MDDTGSDKLRLILEHTTTDDVRSSTDDIGTDHHSRMISDQTVNSIILLRHSAGVYNTLVSAAKKVSRCKPLTFSVS